MDKDKKDKRGRKHLYYSDVYAANLRYDKEERDNIEKIRTLSARAAEAAEEQNRLLKKAAEAALEQTATTRRQNQLLEEQNRLLMMTPEERSAYKNKMEEDERRKQEALVNARQEDERRKQEALVNARLEEQRRKEEEAAYWSSPAGVEARKLTEEEASRARRALEKAELEKEKNFLYLLIKNQTEEISSFEELIANSSGFGAIKCFLFGGVAMDVQEGSEAIDSCRSRIAKAKERLKLVDQKIKQYQ